MVFLKDVERFKRLRGSGARQQVALKLFDRFCAPENLEYNLKRRGASVFAREESSGHAHSDKSHLLGGVDDEKTVELYSHTHGTLSGSASTGVNSVGMSMSLNSADLFVIFSPVFCFIYHDLWRILFFSSLLCAAQLCSALSQAKQ